MSKFERDLQDAEGLLRQSNGFLGVELTRAGVVIVSFIETGLAFACIVLLASPIVAPEPGLGIAGLALCMFTSGSAGLAGYTSK